MFLYSLVNALWRKQQRSIINSKRSLSVVHGFDKLATTNDLTQLNGLQRQEKSDDDLKKC